MFTETKKVLAVAALIVATGIAGVELTRTSAQADATLVPGGAAGYAGSRVEQAFDLVAAMPPAAPISVPVAEKGDLAPVGCAGPFKADVIAECIDAAYEVESEPDTIVETRTANSSILMRMHAFAMAGIQPEEPQSE